MATPNYIPTTNTQSICYTWWKQLAYRHKLAEFLMYFMFVSGILLWDALTINWPLARIMLISHMIIGATIFTLVVGAFWSSHRELIKTSNKAFLKQTGTLIEWLLASCTLSGFYVFLIGNTGNSLNVFIENIHFYSSWLLVPLVFRHALRWSIINIKNYF